ncbi:hypothetical protein ACF090_42530 [Streptomyces sp. NPDC014892]|uniref:hypothetical protein n=1 Tax=Streptomyces sp. NPDC014892 TaxID=3364930 RepID=UPI0036F90561
MLYSLASSKHVGLIGGKEDLSCPHLDLSSLLGEALRLRAESNQAEPENTAADLDVKPV